MSLIDEINVHIKDEQPLHIEYAIRQDLNWDDVIPHFQDCADNVKGKPINILSYQIPNAENVKLVGDVMEFFSNNLTAKVVDADFFVSFTKKTNSHPPHKDDHNVILWNAVGQVAVNIYQDPKEKPIYAKKLGKNDVLFIPHWVYHEVIPLSARATVSFGLETSVTEAKKDEKK